MIAEVQSLLSLNAGRSKSTLTSLQQLDTWTLCGPKSLSDAKVALL